MLPWIPALASLGRDDEGGCDNMGPSMRVWQLTLLGMSLALSACQSRPSVPPDVAQAACTAQRYMSINGFFAAPAERARLTFTPADERKYFVNGKIDYEWVLRDRHDHFTGALQGVRVPEDRSKFLVIYGPASADPNCLHVSADGRIAYFPETACDETIPLIKVRESQLSCEAK